MTQEEKAKAYDEALKKIKVLQEDWKSTHNRAWKEIEEVFPQLAESEDERIKEELINFLRNYFYEEYQEINLEKIGAWINWLEGQKEGKAPGEEELSKFCEANFNAGKRIVLNNPEEYGLQKTVWSEEDEENCTKLNKILYKLEYPYATHADVDYSHKEIVELRKWFCELKDKWTWKPNDNQMSMFRAIVNDPNNVGAESCHLAMLEKEQKHILKFKVGDKVHLEGDDVNILTITGIEKDRYLTDNSYGPILFGAEDIWQIVEQKPVGWSKNDTVFLNEITDFFENKTTKLQHDLDMYAHWLKSLPERFNLQPKAEWSKEDEKIFNDIVRFFNEPGFYLPIREGSFYGNWLKSIRPQPKQEWSEDDKEIIYSIRSFLTQDKVSGRYGSIQITQIEKCVNWIKSLLEGTGRK